MEEFVTNRTVGCDMLSSNTNNFEQAQQPSSNKTIPNAFHKGRIAQADLHMEDAICRTLPFYRHF